MSEPTILNRGTSPTQQGLPHGSRGTTPSTPTNRGTVTDQLSTLYSKVLKKQEEIELQEFLKAYAYIKAEIDKEKMSRVMQVHPAKIKSSIFKTSVVIGKYYKEIAIFVSMALDFVPGIGWLKGVAEAAIGRDLITGDEIPNWARGLIAVISFIPFAKSAFSTIRGGARLAGAAGKMGAHAFRKYGKIAVLAYELQRKVDPAKLYLITKRLSKVSAQTEKNLQIASRILPGRALSKVEKAATADVAKTLAVLEAEANRLSQTASGIIDAGKSLSRTISGTILPKKAPVAKKVAASVAKNVSVVLKRLTKAGYTPKTIKALEAGLKHLDDKAINRLVNRLIRLKKVGRYFCEYFHQCHGFNKIMIEFAADSTSKFNGAKFVMRFVLGRRDIMRKVRVDPGFIVFEFGVGKLTTVKGVERVAREVDIIVRGSRSLGVATTRFMELKNWSLASLRSWWAEKSISKQFVRDIAILDPKNIGEIRWVFNSAKIARHDKSKVVNFFMSIIQKDHYLTKVWGTDAAEIRSILNEMIIL